MTLNYKELSDKLYTIKKICAELNIDDHDKKLIENFLETVGDLINENIDLKTTINLARARLAGAAMAPFAEAGINFDKKKKVEEVVVGVPGHSRRTSKKVDEDRRKK